jgi:parallel beta-helix repeat protein
MLPTAAAKENEMKREVFVRALLAALSVALLGSVPAQAATQISSCPYTISAPGVYQVTQDLSCSGTAITITASKVDLHLNGYTISGSGGGSGIFVQGAANVSIQNGTVQGFFFGVELEATAGCKVTSVTAKQNSDSGFVAGSGTLGLTLTGCVATQNANNGIVLFGDSRSSSVIRNTANGNGYGGITLAGAFANSVTNNTTNDNGCTGISLYTASGNTIERNTTDRNGCVGINIQDNSNGNTVSRNSATANIGHGISVTNSTQNTVQNNTVSGNAFGIILEVGPTQNTIQGNTSTLNILGIWVEAGATGNTLQGNTALNNRDWDLGDQNSNCDSNAWSSNQFVTDNVAGASDGGPNAGCIR